MSDKSPRILIVDDDDDNLANLADILSEHGYNIETACDGEIALERIATLGQQNDSRFNLCLLDFKMPGMNGVELLQKIHSSNPHLRAIMITAYAGEDGTQRALAAGTWRVLSKPIDIAILLSMIDEAVSDQALSE